MMECQCSVFCPAWSLINHTWSPADSNSSGRIENLLETGTPGCGLPTPALTDLPLMVHYFTFNAHFCSCWSVLQTRLSRPEELYRSCSCVLTKRMTKQYWHINTHVIIWDKYRIIFFTGTTYPGCIPTLICGGFQFFPPTFLRISIY